MRLRNVLFLLGAATLSGGADVATAQGSVPGAPDSLSASAGDGEVASRWAAADSNGSSITGYGVRYRRDVSDSTFSSWSIVSGGGSARADTVSGLTNGNSYRFEVRATNGVGDGPSSSIIVTPAGVPGAPDSFSVASGEGEAALGWAAADSNGSSITGYSVRYRGYGIGAPWSSWSIVPGGGSARADTVSGLTNGSYYEFEVRATNGVGDGAASYIGLNLWTPAGVPDAPDSLSASAGDGEVALRWAAADSNGSSITGYGVRYRLDVSGSTFSSWSIVPGGGSGKSHFQLKRSPGSSG